LLDGDKIAALAAGFIKEQLDLIPALRDSIQVGVVQTAYANGSSTAYFEQHRIPVAFTQTGVKHLHHRAEQFDIGVYFEANGHGTVLFSRSTIQSITSVSCAGDQQAENARETLLALVDLINQTVGDALSDMLLVEAILARRQWTLEQWASIYQDLPNRQLKVKVADRSVFKTTDADRQLDEPIGIQALINNLLSLFPQGRSFVRYGLSYQ
jgi:phosphoacetylglucosamine mutase